MWAITVSVLLPITVVSRSMLGWVSSPLVETKAGCPALRERFPSGGKWPSRSLQTFQPTPRVSQQAGSLHSAGSNVPLPKRPDFLLERKDKTGTKGDNPALKIVTPLIIFRFYCVLSFIYFTFVYSSTVLFGYRKKEIFFHMGRGLYSRSYHTALAMMVKCYCYL